MPKDYGSNPALCTFQAGFDHMNNNHKNMMF